jgi:ribosomal protein S12 methylthiotransferase
MPEWAAGRPLIYVHTLGCPKNEADSRSLIRTLESRGAVVVADPNQATHIVVNTCGFIREAKEESIAVILDTCASFRSKQIVVVGCLVQRYREELEKGIPEVAGWLGLIDNASEEELLCLLGVSSSGRTPPTFIQPGRRREVAVTSYAYLKISDGCDEGCTFCAIPGIKGAYRAVGLEAVLREADACLAEGARELVLVGQDTAVWRNGAVDLAALLDELAGDERVSWLRLMYLQPQHITELFLERIACQPKVCRYLDLPFQHSHRDILRRMGRAGDADSYLDLLQRARRALPGVAVRSAFVVGFPGETEAHFEHLLEFVREAEFDYAGGFVYSPEEGTPAAQLNDRVPGRQARERLNRLNQVLEEVAERVHARLTGTTAGVMIDEVPGDERADGEEAIGRTGGQAPEVDGVVHIEGRLPEKTRVGDVVTVRIDGVVGWDLVGTYVES